MSLIKLEAILRRTASLLRTLPKRLVLLRNLTMKKVLLQRRRRTRNRIFFKIIFMTKPRIHLPTGGMTEITKVISHEEMLQMAVSFVMLFTLIIIKL